MKYSTRIKYQFLLVYKKLRFQMQSHQLIPNPDDQNKLDEVWIGNRMATAMFYVRITLSYFISCDFLIRKQLSRL